MPSISNSLSCGPSSVSNSSEYDRPEHPPPFTPIRRNTVSGRCWACLSSLTCLAAASDRVTAIARPLPSRGRRRGPRPRGGGPPPVPVVRPPPSGGGRGGLGPGERVPVLVPVVRQRRLDRVLGQHRAVDLDGRQPELVHDVRVLDLPGLVDRLALEPLGGQARRGDRAPAPEGLEPRVLDHAGVEVHLDLQLHHVAAFRRPDEPPPHPPPV